MATTSIRPQPRYARTHIVHCVAVCAAIAAAPTTMPARQRPAPAGGWTGDTRFAAPVSGGRWMMR